MSHFPFEIFHLNTGAVLGPVATAPGSDTNARDSLRV